MPGFDKTFCMNRQCHKADTCGRSIKRLDGQRAIVSMSAFKPEADGTCKHELPYEEYTVPAWMDGLCRKYEKEYQKEKDLRATANKEIEL